jgi:hypothetical protein
MEMKQCRDPECGEWLPLDNGFYTDKHSPDGYQYICKKCSAKHGKQYRETHVEEIRNYKIQWYEAQKAIILEEKGLFFEQHKETINQISVPRILSPEELDQVIKNSQCKYKDGCELYINEIKMIIGCQRCGCHDYRVLAFHHIDPSLKLFTIGRNKGLPKEQIESEIKKCVVLCYNCHSIIHNELGYRKKIITLEDCLKVN